MQKRFLMTAVTILSLCLSGAAFAGAATWTGDFNVDFMAPLNWSSETAPVAGDVLYIGAGSYYDPNYNTGTTTSVGIINITEGGNLLVNSGTLRTTSSTSETGGCTVYSESLANGIVVNSGATFRSNQNVYIGREGHLGGVTVNAGGSFVCGATTTIGYQSSETVGLGGILRLYGGTADLGVGLRMDPAIATSKTCRGHIDMRYPASFFVDVNGVSVSAMNSLISLGRVYCSQPGYAPVVSSSTEIVPGKTKTVVTATQVYYATNPSPADVNIPLSASQTLSWVNPLPRAGGDTVTSNVYFGTNYPPTTLQASGYGPESIVVSTTYDTRYYWRVDSIDSNGGSPITTTGQVWTFGTFIAPTVNAGYNGRQAALRVSTSPADVNAVAVLVASASDDGYPSALNYTWSAGSDDPNVSYNPSANVLNPTVTFDTPKDYTLTLTVGDGARTADDAMTVRVFAADDYCNAAKFPTTWDAMTGDVNEDCTVNTTDLAVLVAEWLQCNSLECQ